MACYNKNLTVTDRRYRPSPSGAREGTEGGYRYRRYGTVTYYRDGLLVYPRVLGENLNVYA